MIKVDDIIMSQSINNENIVVSVDGDLFIMETYVFKAMLEGYMRNNPLITMDEYLKNKNTV